jgi:hypothetical protein
VTTDQPTTTWRRFTWAVAVLGGLALTVGLALSYGSVYRVAYNAGFDDAWLDGGGWQLRPAHLFPLTLDVPVLVGYAGTIALAGRRSVAWARLVLIACSAATIAAQIIDGAGLVVEHAWVRALVHGWPPLLAVLTTHLLVKILQALGFLVPPVAEAERPSWVARTWAWVAQAVADMRATRRALDRGDMDRTPATTPGADTREDARGDLAGDVRSDSAGDTRPDAGTDTESPSAADSGPDIAADNPQVAVPKLTLTQRRLVDRVIAREITQVEAAKKANVSTKTIGRWVTAVRAAQDRAVAS